MPAENIATEERAMIVTAEVKIDAPILGLMNTDLKGEFGTASGDTLSVLVPGFGTVNEGIALPSNPAEFALSIQKIPLKVSPKNVPVSYDLVDAAVRIGNFESKIATTSGANLARTVRQEAFSCILAGASRAFVAGSLSDLKFSFLGEAIAAVRDASMNGKIGGAISNKMNSVLVNSGLNQFQNGNVAFDLWRGKIKSFDDADFVSQPEVVSFKTPNADFGAGSVVNAALSEGGDKLALKLLDASGSAVANTEIPAGYVFYVDGVNSVDIFKKDSGESRAFVVLPDSATDTDGLKVYSNPKSDANGIVTVNIYPLYASDKALKNATRLPAANDALSFPLAKNRDYQTGVIFDRNAAVYASAAIKEAPGTDSSTSVSVDFVNIRMTSQYEIKSGLNIVRFDMLTGGKALYPHGIAGIWVPA